MKRYFSLLLAFVMVLGMIPVTGMAAEEAATNSIVEDFEDVVLSDAAPDNVNGVLNYKEAVIASAPGRTGNAVKLYDADKTTNPEIRFSHDSTTHVVVEFDIYATTTTNISLRFGTSALTAVFMQFRSDGVYNYRYDTASKTGAYELFSEKAAEAKLVANEWNSFRIEVTLVNGCGQTKLTVNDVDYGTSDAYYRTNTAMDNFYVQSVSASQAIYIDNLKMTADPTAQTFESMTLGAAPTAPFANGFQATVAAHADAAGKSNRAAYLDAVKDGAIAMLRYVSTPSTTMVAEFDFKVGSGMFQARISNGTRSNPNTAFYVRTSGLKLQYVDGSGAWKDLKTYDAYFVTWKTMRIEASLDKALVYINGELAGEIPACGGGYGSNATTGFDSIVFEAAKGHKYYVDNVKVIPQTLPSVEQNFDNVVVSAPIVSVPADGTESGFVDPHNASIVKASGGREGNALYLCADGVTKPDFDYKFDFTEEFSYEFDFFVNGTYDAINFQSYTGCANTVEGKNDAYIFTLDDSTGLRTLKNNGGWATINADVKPNLGQWNNLRVTVNADGEKKAVIYLNDVEVHSTGEFYSKGDPMYGLYVSTGSQNQSAYIDNLNIDYVPYVAPANVNITWNIEGVETTVECPVGTVPVYEGTPAKAADKDHHYTFTGWDKEIVAATAEGATYTAVFTAEEHKGEWVTIQYPDMFNEGAKQRICDVCSYESFEILPKDEGFADTEVGLMLEKDVVLDELILDADKTLNLNGHTLTVTNMIVYGSIIDTSEGNTGKLIAETVVFQGESMDYMPIYDSVNGCYKFFDYELKNLGARKNGNGTVTYGFAIDFANIEAYALLASGDCGVKVNMTLAWGENNVPFAFDAALVQQYADLQAKFSALRAAMMLTVSGVDTLEAGQTLTVTPAVEASGLTAGGDAMVYTVA